MRDGVALLIDDLGAEIEMVCGRAITSMPLDTDALLTLRDGCDAAFKLWQVKQRNGNGNGKRGEVKP